MKNIKKFVFILLIIVFVSEAYCQVGYLGKRNVLSTDIRNTYYQNKYNLSYNFCIGKSLMTKITYSHAQNNFNSDYEWQYYAHDINQPVGWLSVYNVENTDLNINGNSWEFGILYGATGMPMPLGYYIGFAYEHYRGVITEDCKVQSHYNGQPPLFDKQLIFENKTGIYKLLLGRNAYMKYNLLLNVCLELGYYSGQNILTTENMEPTVPVMIVPLSSPFNKINHHGLDVTINGIETNRLSRFYIMPAISIGYIF
jgi:hypothetical protein